MNIIKRVTQKDIAYKLNLTVSTVSHVLNGLNDISKETAEKVLFTAKEMGYIPNNSAISLRSGKTNSIAIIVPDISNPHLAHQIKLIEDRLKKKGYSVMIMNTNESQEEEYAALISACSKQVDGIMLCPTQHNAENIFFLQSQNIPYLLIGRYFRDYDFDYVCSDDVKGGYIAGEYLVNKNFQNPIYIGANKYVESSLNRFIGLQDALRKNDIILPDNRYFEVDPTSSNLFDVFNDICKRGIPFDSIVAFSDLFAFKLLSEIQNTFLISFDASCRHLYIPSLTPSIGMDNIGWSKKATSILLKKINGSKKKYMELIDVKIYLP